MTEPRAISDQEFEQVVLASDKLVLVDFWAPWCAPCRVVSPILEDLASQYQDRVSIVKVNTDSNAHYSAAYQVQGLPTLIFFRNGQEVDRMIGAGPRASYQRKLEELLARS